jgi:hypothetical protein
MTSAFELIIYVDTIARQEGQKISLGHLGQQKLYPRRSTKMDLDI